MEMHMPWLRVIERTGDREKGEIVFLDIIFWGLLT